VITLKIVLFAEPSLNVNPFIYVPTSSKYVPAPVFVIETPPPLAPGLVA